MTYKQTCTELQCLPKSEVNQWLNSFDTVLTDCDGESVGFFITSAFSRNKYYNVTISLSNYVIFVTFMKFKDKMCVFAHLFSQYFDDLLFFQYFPGVLWIHANAIDGSASVINKFKDMGKKVFFVTNNSTRTRSEAAVKAQQLKFNITEVRIFLSCETAIYIFYQFFIVVSSIG